MHIRDCGNVLLTVGLLSLATAGHVFATPRTQAQQAIDDCVGQILASQVTVNQDAPIHLDTACPELGHQLDAEIFAQLQPPLQQDTTFRQLHDVQRSLRSFSAGPPAQQQALDHPALPGLLEDIYEPYIKPELPPNPIDEFWSWVGDKLREFFDEDNWLTRNFDFSPTADKGLFEGLKNTVIVVLIVMVLYILISELRAANVIGLLKRRRRRHGQRETASHDIRAQVIRHLQDIQALPHHQQVPALLRYAIRHLIELQVLPRQYSLTNREFLALVHKNLPAVAQDFETLISTGERVVYGNQSLPAGAAAQLFEHVRHIEHPPGKDRP